MGFMVLAILEAFRVFVIFEVFVIFVILDVFCVFVGFVDFGNVTATGPPFCLTAFWGSWGFCVFWCF